MRHAPGLSFVLRIRTQARDDNLVEGDNSDKVGYGYRYYGKGHDMEWQKGLPTAAKGVESIDIEGLLSTFEYAGDISGASNLTDIKQFIKNEKVNVFLEKLDNIVNAVSAGNEACEGCLEPTEDNKNISLDIKEINIKPLKPADVILTIIKQRTSQMDSNGDVLHTSADPEKPDTVRKYIYYDKPAPKSQANQNSSNEQKKPAQAL